MKTQLCQNCHQVTQHQVTPVVHQISEDASNYTCTQCGFVTTVIPHIEELNVNVAVPPVTLPDGAILLRATSLTVDGKQLPTNGEVNIKINTHRAINMTTIA